MNERVEELTIEQFMPAQLSLRDQLKDVVKICCDEGLYDAASYIHMLASLVDEEVGH